MGYLVILGRYNGVFRHTKGSNRVFSHTRGPMGYCVILGDPKVCLDTPGVPMGVFRNTRGSNGVFSQTTRVQSWYLNIVGGSNGICRHTRGSNGIFRHICLNGVFSHIRGVQWVYLDRQGDPMGNLVIPGSPMVY